MFNMPASSLTLPQRFLSVDVLRGLTITLMIVVNNPGDESHVWWPLDHAVWSGYTLADLVFPTFLYLIGCSVVFSTASRLAKGADRKYLAFHVFRRSLILLLLGWLLTLMPFFQFSTFRFYGILTRIALCYFVVGLVFVFVQRPTVLAGICCLCILGYWALMRFVPVPGAGIPTHEIPLLDPTHNLVAWLDRGVVACSQRYLHVGRLYQADRDPEGLLSTVPAIATTLLGVLTGLYLRGPQPVRTKVIGMAFSGTALVAMGYLWAPWFPLNKNLWTSSYVLVSGGWTLLIMTLLYWILDVRRAQLQSRAIAICIWPWQVFGSNAIAAYIVSIVFIKVLTTIHIGINAFGKPVRVSTWIYNHVFAVHGSTRLTSHGFALAFTLLCFMPIWLLWRRRIFLKI